MPLRNRHATRSRARLIEELRCAIDCLPVATREAMLAGVRDERQPIIAGAYTDGDGGACPMLAAHRRGGRTDFLAFAHAWDRFTGARKARRVTRRELRVLISHLETSLLADAAPDLARAVAEHCKAVELRRRRESRHVRLSQREEDAAAPIAAVDPRGEIRARRLRPRSWAARRPGRLVPAGR